MPSGVYKRRPFSKEYRDKLSVLAKERVALGITGFKKGYTPWNKGLHTTFNAGANNWNWKGGISKLRPYRHNTTPKYVRWRSEILKRDNYTCKKCGKRQCYLEVHHIKSYTHYPELRYDMKNAITLCKNCHRLTDNYAGRGAK